MGSATVTPPEIDHVAIFNTQFKPLAEDFESQIVFAYNSRIHSPAAAQRLASLRPEERARATQKAHDSIMMKIGVTRSAQKLSETFGAGRIDSVELSKGRAVICELEPSWWITMMVKYGKSVEREVTGNDQVGKVLRVNYLQRDAPPAFLLLQLLRRAHRTFLLLNCHSLDEYMRSHGLERLTGSLGEFWTRLCVSWKAFITGNPVLDAFNGTTLGHNPGLLSPAGDASGQAKLSLRAEIESVFDDHKDLNDLLIFRYGDDHTRPEATKSPQASPAKEPSTADLWIGNGKHPQVGDGLVYAGCGNLSFKDVRAISHFIERLYTVNSESRRFRLVAVDDDRLCKAGEEGPEEATEPPQQDKKGPPQDSDESSPMPAEPKRAGRENTLGSLFSFSYGIPFFNPPTAAPADDDGGREAAETKSRLNRRIGLECDGCFLLEAEDPASASTDRHQLADPLDEALKLSTFFLRTVEEPGQVLVNEAADESGGDIQHQSHALIYIHRPFVFVLLFEPKVDHCQLRENKTYEAIHNFTSAIYNNLLNETAIPTEEVKSNGLTSFLSSVRSPKWRSSGQKSERGSSANIGLVYCPRTLFIRSTIPPIPRKGEVIRPPVPNGSDGRPVMSWSWDAAVHVHQQVLRLVGDFSNRPKLVNAIRPRDRDDLMEREQPGDASPVLDTNLEFTKSSVAKGWSVSWSAVPSAVDSIDVAHPRFGFGTPGAGDGLGSEDSFGLSRESSPVAGSRDGAAQAAAGGPIQFSFPEEQPHLQLEPHTPFKESIIVTFSESRNGIRGPPVPPLPASAARRRGQRDVSGPASAAYRDLIHGRSTPSQLDGGQNVESPISPTHHLSEVYRSREKGSRVPAIRLQESSNGEAEAVTPQATATTTVDTTTSATAAATTTTTTTTAEQVEERVGGAGAGEGEQGDTPQPSAAMQDLQAFLSQAHSQATNNTLFSATNAVGRRGFQAINKLNPMSLFYRASSHSLPSTPTVEDQPASSAGEGMNR